MILISKSEVEHLLRNMTRAEYYCSHAISMHSPEYDDHVDPTRTYPGASGYAQVQLCVTLYKPLNRTYGLAPDANISWGLL